MTAYFVSGPPAPESSLALPHATRKNRCRTKFDVMAKTRLGETRSRGMCRNLRNDRSQFFSERRSCSRFREKPMPISPAVTCVIPPDRQMWMGAMPRRVNPRGRKGHHCFLNPWVSRRCGAGRTCGHGGHRRQLAPPPAGAAFHGRDEVQHPATGAGGKTMEQVPAQGGVKGTPSKSRAAIS
jgi:hypothetical protein